MVMTAEFAPKGIWYEEKRDRWRVKLFCDGVLYHRSYHKKFEAAVLAWKAAKIGMAKPRAIIPLKERSPINQFLCQPLPGVSRVQGH